MTDSNIKIIEKELGLVFPDELLQVYQLLSNQDGDRKLSLNMKGTNKHWFLDSDYELIRTSDKIEDGFIISYRYFHSYNGDNQIINHSLEIRSYQDEWKWDGKKMLVFAHTNTIVDGGGFLFYSFNNEGEPEGIFCTAYGWINMVVHVSKTLSELFEIEIKKSKGKNYLKPKPKKLITDFRKVIESHKYIDLDAEFGVVMGFSTYKKFIDDTLIPLSQGQLKYDDIYDLSEQENIFHLEWELSGKRWSEKLDVKSDYIDGKIFALVNKVLKGVGISARFIPFHESGHGTDFILGYFDPVDQVNFNKVSSVYPIEC